MEKLKFKPERPDYKKIIEEKLTRQFFMKHIGMKLTSIEPGWVEAELDLDTIHLQQNLFVHGGVMSTAADVVMGFAAYTLCKSNKGVVTANLNINYVNPGKGEKLIAYGRVRKMGSKLFFCEAEVYVVQDKEKVLTNTAESIMSVIDLVPIS